MARLKVAVIPVTAFAQNCSLVYDEDSGRGVVVDPGGDVAKILAAIAQQKVQVEAIWLTHGHIDHAGGAAELKEKLGGVPILGPDERDRFLLDKLAESGRSYGLEARAVTPDRWLREGETVEVAGLSFSLLHCPGHTPGSLVYFNERNRFALVGDVLFRGSIGRTDFEYGDHDALIAAIREKLFPLGDDVVFLCGHGSASSFGEERQSNPFVGEG